MHTNKETIIRGYYNIEVGSIVVSQSPDTSAKVYFLKTLPQCHGLMNPF